MARDAGGILYTIVTGPISIPSRNDGDTRSPSLTAFAVSPAVVDLSAGPASISCALTASDDENGVSGLVSIRDSAGRFLGAGSFAGTGASHSETMIIALPQWLDSGATNMAEISITITDASGRAQTYGAPDSPAWPAGSVAALQIAPATLSSYQRKLAACPGLAPSLTSDADGDGLLDVLELALGTHPMLPSGENGSDIWRDRRPFARMICPSSGPPSFKLSFKPDLCFVRTAPDTFSCEGWHLRLESSSDLITWYQDPLSDRDLSGHLGTSFVPQSGSSLYFRLKLTPPP